MLSFWQAVTLNLHEHFFFFPEYTVWTNREGEEKMEDTNEKNEVMLFTAPRTVKRRKFSDIVLFQLIVSASFLAFLLVLKFGVPQIFENVIRFIRENILC